MGNSQRRVQFVDLNPEKGVANYLNVREGSQQECIDEMGNVL